MSGARGGPPAREGWSSRLGFVLASVGAAVGIGNLWRFPYVVGTSGGGAFLIPYLAAVVACGLPLMLVELGLGRHWGCSVLPTLAAIRPAFRWPGLLLVLVVTLILSDYLVITGWVLAYALAFAAGAPRSFDAFTGSYWPLPFHVGATLLCFVVVRAGVRRGIERLSVTLMPLMVALLLVLAGVALSLPGAGAGVRHYLTPDFARLAEPAVWMAAFGQAFFSLGVGVGIMFSSGMDPAGGVQLAFVTLPRIFEQMPLGFAFGAAFFALLAVAALTSAVAIMEVPVATLVDAWGLSRRRAAAIAAGGVLVLGLPSAPSYTPLRLQALGMPLLDLVDFVSGTVGMIAGGLMLSLVAGWFAPPDAVAGGLAPGGWPRRLLLGVVRLLVPLALASNVVVRLLTPPVG